MEVIVVRGGEKISFTEVEMMISQGGGVDDIATGDSGSDALRGGR